MNLEFKLYKISEESWLFKLINKYDDTNEFIVVGEKIIEGKEYFKVHQLGKNGLQLVGGLKLDELAYSIPKSEVKLLNDGDIGIDYTELDIPKEYLTMGIIENIQRLNVI